MDPPALSPQARGIRVAIKAPGLPERLAYYDQQKSMVFDTIIELALQECSAHGQDENVLTTPVHWDWEWWLYPGPQAKQETQRYIALKHFQFWEETQALYVPSNAKCFIPA
jgi:hypothetical protein